MKQTIVGKVWTKSRSDRIPVTICRWIIWIGLILALLVPLVVKADLYYPFSTTKGLWFMGVMIPTFAAWVWLTLVDGRYRLELNWVLVTLVAYLLSATFSALSGPDPTLSFWSKHERLAGVIAHFHLFTFFLVLSSFLREEKDWKTFFFFAVSIASLVSFWGLAQNHGFTTAVSVFDSLHFISEDVSAISNKGSTLGNTSFMGSYLQMNAFLAIYLIVTSAGHSRVLAVVSFTLILLGVYLNPGGRAMRYSFLAGLILIAFLYLAVKSDRVAVRGFSKFVLCSAGLVSFALFFASLSDGSVVNERFSAIRGGGARIETWKMAWEGIREKPIFGWGFENFELAFYRHFNPEILVGIGTTVQEHWYDRSHNVVFDLLLTGGFVGAGLFFLVVAVSLYALWNDCFLSDRRRLGVCVVLTAMFAAHFIQNLSVFDMLPSYMLLFATLAYVSSRAAPIVSVVHRFREFRPASAVPILACICLSFASGAAFYHFVYKPHRVARIVAKFSAGSLPGPLKNEYIVASETSPVGRHQVRIQLAESAMKRLEFLENSEKDVFYLGEVDYVISQLEKSAKESPLNFRIHYTAGQLNAAAAFRLSLVGGGGREPLQKKALEYVVASELAFQRAIDLSPKNVLAYWGLSRALIYKGFISADDEFHKSALVIAECAVAIEPRIFASHDLAVDITANLVGDRDLALGKVRRAEKIDPRWRSRLMAHLRKARSS